MTLEDRVAFTRATNNNKITIINNDADSCTNNDHDKSTMANTVGVSVLMITTHNTLTK